VLQRSMYSCDHMYSLALQVWLGCLYALAHAMDAAVHVARVAVVATGCLPWPEGPELHGGDGDGDTAPIEASKAEGSRNYPDQGSEQVATTVECGSCHAKAAGA
jgi:hypothetical protein